MDGPRVEGARADRRAARADDGAGRGGALAVCALAVCALAAACGGAGARTIVESRDLPRTSSAPSVSRVTDLGDLGAIPAPGQPLPAPDSDGVFVVGELIYIEGGSFGRQPTITIGGRSAAELGRTGSGGILTRIPPGTPTGAVEVEVSHGGGRSARSIEVVRYALVVHPDGELVHLVSIDAAGIPAVRGALKVPGARAAALSADGQVAYVAAGDSLAVVALTASGGPKVVRTLKLGTTGARLVTSARDGQLAVVIGDRALVLVELRDPRNPALYQPVQIGAVAQEVIAAALEPRGRTLMLLLASANALVPVDVSRPQKVALSGRMVPLLPGERVPLVAGMDFSPDGNELWVVAGDNLEALAVGVHPTRLIAVRVGGAEPTVRRVVEISGAAPPRALAAAPRDALETGTSIRAASRRAVLAVAGIDRAVLRRLRDAEDPGRALLDKEPGDIGHVLRTDLEGDSRTLWSAEALVSDLRMSYDAQFIVAAATRLRRQEGTLRLELGLVVVPLAGGEARFVRLGDVTADRAVAGAIAALTLTP